MFVLLSLAILKRSFICRMAFDAAPEKAMQVRKLSLTMVMMILGEVK